MKAFFLSLAVLVVFLADGARAQFNIDRIVEGAGKVVKGSSGIGINEEMDIGGSVAIEIAAMYGGVWKDEEAARRVNLIGKTLGRYSDRPGLPYRFAILNNDAINGFSAPGGYVFITKGAYLAAENDDQLAGLLAHEIAHVTRRHALKIISRTELISGLTEVAAGSGHEHAQYDIGVDKISATLLKTGYDTGTEFDADRMGRELAANVGFAKDGLLQFLQQLNAKNPGSSVAFSTHPPLADRIKRLGGDPDVPVSAAGSGMQGGGAQASP